MMATVLIYFVWCYAALASRKNEWQITVTLNVFPEAKQNSAYFNTAYLVLE